MREWLIRKLGGVPKWIHMRNTIELKNRLGRANERLQDLQENTPKRDPKTGRFVRRDG